MVSHCSRLSPSPPRPGTASAPPSSGRRPRRAPSRASHLRRPASARFGVLARNLGLALRAILAQAIGLPAIFLGLELRDLVLFGLLARVDFLLPGLGCLLLRLGVSRLALLLLRLDCGPGGGTLAARSTSLTSALTAAASLDDVAAGAGFAYRRRRGVALTPAGAGATAAALTPCRSGRRRPARAGWPPASPARSARMGREGTGALAAGVGASRLSGRRHRRGWARASARRHAGHRSVAFMRLRAIGGIARRTGVGIGIRMRLVGPREIRLDERRQALRHAQSDPS